MAKDDERVQSKKSQLTAKYRDFCELWRTVAKEDE
jgi:hypothetical protein